MTDPISCVYCGCSRNHPIRYPDEPLPEIKSRPCFECQKHHRACVPCWVKKARIRGAFPTWRAAFVGCPEKEPGR